MDEGENLVKTSIFTQSQSPPLMKQFCGDFLLFDQHNSRWAGNLSFSNLVKYVGKSLENLPRMFPVAW